ncbi:MAG: low affinity iron permease family protein [Ignavibacteria bacterium]
MAKQVSKNNTNEHIFEKLALKITKFSGSTTAFVLAFGLVIIWAATGPIFNFSEAWQLVINTGTTIITFLMVFLIQRSQNKESIAMQLKLNELIAAVKGASNRLIDAEDMSESELNVLKRHYDKLVKLAEKDEDIKMSHSIEDAEKRHKAKIQKIKIN